MNNGTLDRLKRHAFFGLIAVCFMGGSFVSCDNPTKSLVKGKASYESGEYDKALTFLSKAAEQDSVEAIYLIGTMFEAGLGMEQSLDEAMKWYLKAAEMGYEQAFLKVGDAYFFGLGLGQNYEDAKRWLEKAAETGSAEACYRLGEIYECGRGVEVDYMKARNSFQEALELGDENALEALRRVENEDVASIGAFSVSSTQKVRFSKGNLQYQASTDTWRFATRPWDVLGTNNNIASKNNSNWIDLFMWGTGKEPLRIVESVIDDPDFVDWGTNEISNGGPYHWRTMTKDELTFLISRSTQSGICFAKAEVNGVNGVILLPDDWESETFEFTNPNDGVAGYGSNRIEKSQWEIIESKGAVFLPAAGNKSGKTVDHVGYFGDYWSSTPMDGDANTGNAYYLGFNESVLDYDVYFCDCAFSVRLVTEIEK